MPRFNIGDRVRIVRVNPASMSPSWDGMLGVLVEPPRAVEFPYRVKTDGGRSIPVLEDEIRLVSPVRPSAISGDLEDALTIFQARAGSLEAVLRALADKAQAVEANDDHYCISVNTSFSMEDSDDGEWTGHLYWGVT